MSNTIGLGNELQILDPDTGLKRWALRLNTDASLDLLRYNSSGVEQETTIAIGATGEVTIGENIDTAYRTVAADVVPTIVEGDGVIELLSSTAGAKAILTDTSGEDAVELGQEVTIFLTARSAGSYTLALSTGTLTFDAALECAKVVRTSLGWNVVSLNGATIV